VAVKIQFEKHDSLKYLCRSCKYSRIKRKVGLVCELTGERPDFYAQCPNFKLHKFRDNKIHLADHEYQQNLKNSFLIIAFIGGFSLFNFIFKSFELSIVIIMLILLGYAISYASKPFFVNRFGYAPYIYLILAGYVSNFKKNKTSEELRIIQTQVLKMMGWTAIKQANDVLRKNNNSISEAEKYIKKIKTQDALFMFSLICEIYVYYNLNDFLKSNVLKDIALMLNLTTQEYQSIKKKYEKAEINHQKKLKEQENREKQEKERQKRQGEHKFSEKNLSEYFFILRLKEDATNDEIKKQFKKLAVKYHPDKFKDNSDEQKNASEKFKEFAEAYNIIRRKRGF